MFGLVLYDLDGFARQFGFTAALSAQGGKTNVLQEN